MTLFRIRVAVALTCLTLLINDAAAERATLDVDNYDRLAPVGKEVDAIYGDLVLRNDRLVAVVATPVEGRDANLTVRNVGGALIDLTERDPQADQLSCFYPGGGGYRYDEQIVWPTEWGATDSDATTLAVAGYAISPGSDKGARPLRIRTGYELRNGEPFLRVVTTITNTGGEPTDASARDGVRVDGDGFKTGDVNELGLWWAHDGFWRQAYGVQSETRERLAYGLPTRSRRRPQQIVYPSPNVDDARVTLAPGESLTWRRRVFPAADSVAVRTIACANRDRDCCDLSIVVRDSANPVTDALVRIITRDEEGPRLLGAGLTDDRGRYECEVLEGDYSIEVSAQGHAPLDAMVTATPEATEVPFTLTLPAYVEADITDAAGDPIPAKVQFIGLGDTPSPNFGPGSAVHGVANLQYTASGRFKAKLLPGEYRWLASYGPEHDAAEGSFTVSTGETAKISASLERAVDTAGWISSELHSHSTPSGDNTASQRGRVLNLLAEHLEFCPCTEHQRIDVYDEHLEHFDAQRLMLTCAGMELTGQPLPLNHQNAFPLIYKPRRQHAGAPLIDPDPIKQIERLAGWDDDSEKVVQINHSNIAQTVGDRDLDGNPDEGFERMYFFTDVIEVDPPELIFEPLGGPGAADNGVGVGGAEGRGNETQNWLQMLNLGYRVTGVVNTDAHYNHHGSGWLRNWVKSSTDNPAEASIDEMIHSFEHGHVVMSNGPYLEVKAVAGDANAIPGDDLAAVRGKARFRVVVRCPNWLEVNRVQLFLNGRASEEHNYTRRSHREWFTPGPEVFDREIDLTLDEDTHVVVACCGEGRQLGVIYGEQFGKTMPVAIANPIFVDTDGDADGDGIPFEPNGDDLGNPLPTPEGFKPSHGHGHHNHTH